MVAPSAGVILGQRGGHSVLRYLVCVSFVNLQANVPLWRLFDLGVVTHACIIPCGLVLGDGVSSHDLRSHRLCGGVGLECTSF
jgi:hypothetical protein